MGVGTPGLQNPAFAGFFVLGALSGALQNLTAPDPTFTVARLASIDPDAAQASVTASSRGRTVSAHSAPPALCIQHCW